MLQKFDKELEKLYNKKGHLKEGLKIIMKKEKMEMMLVSEFSITLLFDPE